jgi:hypothetical protein
MPSFSRQSLLPFGIALGLLFASWYLLSALLEFSPATPTSNLADAEMNPIIASPALTIPETVSGAVQVDMPTKGTDGELKSEQIPHFQLVGVFLHPNATKSTAVILNGHQSRSYHLQETVYHNWILTKIESNSVVLQSAENAIRLPLHNTTKTNDSSVATTQDMATMTTASQSANSGYKPQSDSEIRQELAIKLKQLRQNPHPSKSPAG